MIGDSDSRRGTPCFAARVVRLLAVPLLLAVAMAGMAPAELAGAAGTGIGLKGRQVLSGAGDRAHGVAVASARGALAAGRAAAPAVRYGVAAATQLSQLPYLQPATMAGGQSSFDRDTYDSSHGNHDLGNFLATGPAGNVMLDQQGPGCVYRIWMTSKQAAFPGDWIKIYFDGSSQPAIDMTMAHGLRGHERAVPVSPGRGQPALKRRLRQLRAPVLSHLDPDHDEHEQVLQHRLRHLSARHRRQDLDASRRHVRAPAGMG